MTTLEKVLSRYGEGEQFHIENHKEIEEAIARMWVKEHRFSQPMAELGLGLTKNTLTSMAVFEPIVAYLQTGEQPVFKHMETIIDSDLEPQLPEIENCLQGAVNMWNSSHLQQEIYRKLDYRATLVIMLTAINKWVFDTRMVKHVDQVIEDYGLAHFKNQHIFSTATARSSQEYTELLIELDDPELWVNADYSIGELFKGYLDHIDTIENYGVDTYS